jgi:predicted acetyltransferase
MSTMEVKLILPQIEDKISFLDGFKELKTKSEQSAWVYLGDNSSLDILNCDFEVYVSTLLQRQSQPPEGFVCDTVYWGTIGNEVVGRISIRHELNDFLRKIGGHIGYIVRPSFRAKGVATEMLRQLLLTEKARSIRQLLLTCDETNSASEKTILKNGGIFESYVDMGVEKPRKKRFWINVL